MKISRLGFLKSRAIYLLIVAVVVLGLLPVVHLGAFYVLALTEVFFFLVVAQMWNISAGYSGIYSFGNAAFVGIGAFTTAAFCGLSNPILSNPALTICIGAALAAAYAAAIGVPAFRLGTIGFSIVTYGGCAIIGGIITYITSNNYLVFVPLYSWNTPNFDYYAMLAVAVASVIVSYSIEKSQFGLRLKAIRDDEDAAKSLRINTTLNKVTIFMISAAFTAMAGSIFALYQGYAEPDTVFSTTFSLMSVLQPILGGIGTVGGPILGTIIIESIDIYTRIYISFLREFILGIFLMVVVLVIPGGILSLFRRRSFQRSSKRGESAP